MAVSVFDLFTIGIGPSSSHTVGPMRAARMFIERLLRENRIGSVERLRVELYGSLGATGKGHGTDKAVLMGLEGETPEGIDPDTVPQRMTRINRLKFLTLHGGREIAFDPYRDMVFLKGKRLPLHSNGMRCTAYDAEGTVLDERVYYSVGGGFVVDESNGDNHPFGAETVSLPYHFTSAHALLEMCERTGLRIDQLMMENEKCWRTEQEIREGLLLRWKVMQECVAKGLRSEGVLPGGLKVVRRAPALHRELQQHGSHDPLSVLDWVNVYAIAVNEENAAGGRVVTAPTNGAAGILPAVLHYYMFHTQHAEEEGVVRFLLTAAAIGMLYKERASISGAEVGCQGEVGVACSMASGALVAALGGSVLQVENAAEIGMEHNLGLTCDPVGGLVQIPCIERNAMGAVKAINAARMAMRGDGTHKVSLDKVIETMRQTGLDMSTKYKETARGGLAINVIEC